ncbi:hypothetical protein ACFXHA_43665 [Nocardia sp. NPDC059240]|uniref:hypothetical protein n=1 Tax=Nocardia sp. NPDC059240 TaxID=3346786 RepID=UPI0036ABC8E4
MAEAAFTRIGNDVCRDTRLSLKARGLFALLSTHADGFQVSVTRLATRLDGREAVMSALAELERYGYLTRRRIRTADGRLGAAEYYITDSPDPDHNADTSAEPSSPRPTARKGKRPSTPESDFPMLESPAPNTTEETPRSSPRQSHSSVMPLPSSAGARILQNLRVAGKPVPAAVIAAHSDRIDDLLRSWPEQALIAHLGAECAGAGVRNPIGLLIWQINQMPAMPTKKVCAALEEPTPRQPCIDCGSPRPGGMLTVTRNGVEAAQPCPRCNHRATGSNHLIEEPTGSPKQTKERSA